MPTTATTPASRPVRASSAGSAAGEAARSAGALGAGAAVLETGVSGPWGAGCEPLLSDEPVEPPPEPPVEPGDWPANGSAYWSSPALCASDAAGEASAARTASTGRARLGRIARMLENGEESRRGSGGRSDSLRSVSGKRAAPSASPPGLARRGRLSRESHTVRAAGLAGAQLVANGLALVATIAFARALGTEGYGELARMVSVFVILVVPATALQAAAARDAALGRLGDAPQAAATLRSWIERTVLATLVVAVVCVLAREQLAHLMQVSDPWGAAMVLPAGVLWTALALQRGVLQGLADYRPVAISLIVEQAVRLALGLGAALAGAGVVGIFALSVPVAIVPVGLLLSLEARRRLGPPEHGRPHTGLRTLSRRNPVPLTALTLFAIVQNVDVVAVAHAFSSSLSGAYAQASVAAKGIIWVAVGVGLYLLPETAREAARGRDPRHLLLRTTGLLALVALPMIAVYLAASERVLDLVFGDEATLASGALPWLGAAMSLLSASYLAIQFALGVGRRAFLVVVAAMAVAVPTVVLSVGSTLTDVAIALTGLNVVFVVAMGALAIRSPRPSPAGLPTVGDADALAAAESAAAAEAAIP